MEESGLHTLVRPHVESFNFIVEKGGALELAVKNFPVQVVDPHNGVAGCRFWLRDVVIERPKNPDSSSSEMRMFPSDCRELRSTYEGRMVATLVLETANSDAPLVIPNISLGMVPIMVRSKLCWLEHMGPEELIRHKEEANELGGYFIVNGNERILRMLIQGRRNQPMALIRPSFGNRGREYTEFATQMRCVRPDQTGQTLTLHYLDTGSCNLRIALRKQEFFLPAVLVLRALIPTTDLEIFQHIVGGDFSNSFFSTRAEIMLRQAQSLGIYSQSQALAYLGKHFRLVMRPPDSVTDEQCGAMLLNQHFFVHLGEGPGSGRRKFDSLVLMIRKLFSLVKGDIKPDSIDATNCHEVLLPGHMYFRCMKEFLEDWLAGVRGMLIRDQRRQPEKVDLGSTTYIRKILDRQASVGSKLKYFVVTGNLRSNSGLDMQQVSGYTIVADKLNFMRYLSHFRSVHRGNFYTQMKTVSVRKLVPESWGFLCPVHTPDGTPCGLLNHLAAPCQVLTHEVWDAEPELVRLLCSMGMTPIYNYGAAGESASPIEDDGAMSAAAASKDPHARRADQQYRRPDQGSATPQLPRPDWLPVILNGSIVGYLPLVLARGVAKRLRRMKVEATAEMARRNKTGFQGMKDVPVHPLMEIYGVYDTKDGLYPSLQLHTGAGRFIRPVYYLTEEDTETYRRLQRQKQKQAKQAKKASQKQKKERNRSQDSDAMDVCESGSSSASEGDLDEPYEHPDFGVQLQTIEWIGAQEQIFLDVGVTDGEIIPGFSTHREIAPENMLSVIASLTPFSDFNQSPRNMYQCQMGKQTMGTPFHAFPYRVDNKVYRIQNPQRPIVRNSAGYDRYRMDEYPIGCNAVVAVISYTGYDMEDAMIINKSSYERGFGHGSVYKYKEVDLGDYRASRSEPIHHRFLNHRDPQDPLGSREVFDLGPDGLPEAGQVISPGGNLYCVHDDVTGRIKVHRYDGTEPCIVEEVRRLAPLDRNDPELQVVGFKLRVNRNPVTGDKFSSRHGQKGVLSTLWPQTDMPFAESGLTPDVIINPHAFPSRMTIGMLIESMAGKVAAHEGKIHDSTPFRYAHQSSPPPAGTDPRKESEDALRKRLTAVDAFGEKLVANGYNRVGTEVLYSGITGCEMTAEIFLGVVYYQRLRHMVSDKSQVRSLGPINNLTRQPVKGRKIHGGIRFGEMERDALLGHGTAFLAHDRLMNSSDYHVTEVCTRCGSLLSPTSNLQLQQSKQRRLKASGKAAKKPEPEKPAAAAAAGADGGAFDFLADAALAEPDQGMDASDPEAGDRACLTCKTTNVIGNICVPYVMMYLANELAAVNIRLTVQV